MERKKILLHRASTGPEVQMGHNSPTSSLIRPFFPPWFGSIRFGDVWEWFVYRTVFNNFEPTLRCSGIGLNAMCKLRSK